MRTDSNLLVVLVALALTACTGVFSVAPVGKEPLVLVTDDWDGTWSDSESSLEIRVVDSNSGRFEAAWIETGEDGFELERVEVLLRDVGEAVIGSALEKNGNGEAGLEAAPGEMKSRYAVFRLARDEGRIIVWWPNIDAFEAAVEKGWIPGKVTEDEGVVLGDLGPDHLELIAGEESASFWLWQEPVVLFRARQP